MNRHDFIRVVAKGAGVTIPVATNIIDTTFDSIASIIADGGDVSITNFGKFYTRTAAARSIKSPWSDEPTQMPERTLPAFKYYGAVKDLF